MGCISGGDGGMSPSSAKETLDSSANLTLIDVRTPGEFGQGHIEGAVNIDYNSPGFRQRISALDRGNTYLLYCRNGQKSAQALGVMREMGFVNVSHIEGGINDWVAKGFPTV